MCAPRRAFTTPLLSEPVCFGATFAIKRSFQGVAADLIADLLGAFALGLTVAVTFVAVYAIAATTKRILRRLPR